MKEYGGDIQFKPVNNGIGFYQDVPQVDSFYKKDDEDQLLASASVDIFHGLKESPHLYDQLIERLENPILESLNQTLDKKNFDRFSKQKSLPDPPIHPYNPSLSMPTESSTIQEESEFQKESPLNKRMLLPLDVLKWDFSFSMGLYLLTWVMISAFFNTTVVPSLLFVAVCFGLFHQLYVVICRSLIGSTLGEERYNIVWNHRSPLYFIMRGLFITLTGFIFIPVCSALLSRDLLENYTGIRPEYNI